MPMPCCVGGERGRHSTRPGVLPLAQTLFNDSPIKRGAAALRHHRGGDTGAEWPGTAHRPGSGSVTQSDPTPAPDAGRDHQPWRLPDDLRTRARTRKAARAPTRDGRWSIGVAAWRVRALQLADAARFERSPASERELPVTGRLAMGFRGPERRLLDGLGVDFVPGATSPGDVVRHMVPGVFAGPETWAAASR